MAVTYDPIATTTLGSAASSITFSSISSAYTDLRLVFTGITPNGGTYYHARFNSDTAGNYSYTALYGSGSGALSNRESNRTNIPIAGYVAGGTSTTIPTFVTMDIASYASSTYKTSLITYSGDFNGSGDVVRMVGLWRSTSAITSVTITSNFSTFGVGATATLYGIKAA
jgi:hypothetical protein